MIKQEFRMFVLKSGGCSCQEGGWMCNRCESIIKKHEEIVDKLREKISDQSWELNPDRMGS